MVDEPLSLDNILPEGVRRRGGGDKGTAHVCIDLISDDEEAHREEEEEEAVSVSGPTQQCTACSVRKPLDAFSNSQADAHR